ncbi:MAG: phosphonate ABC transporter substrate-binding protein [Alphaproteobacteria bacterium]
MAHAAIVATSVLLAGTAQADFKPLDGDPKELNFGIISTESTSNLKAQWLPFLEAMENQLGMKVNAFFAPDYAGIIEGMRFGKVHVAWHGNKSGMEAVDRAGGEVFAQTSKQQDGTEGYYSHIITQANNDRINNLQDLFGSCDKSLDFGIGDPNSTSGFLVPSYYAFAQNGIDPKKCFKTVRNANHETNLMAVANGQVDAAANNSEQINRSTMKAPEAAAKIKVIWTSPLIPNDPIVYRRDLSKELRSRIKGFFLGYGRFGTPEQIAEANRVLGGMSDGFGHFLESNNTQLLPIRQLALFKDRLTVEAGNASDKAAKLEMIDRELDLVAQMVKGF